MVGSEDIGDILVDRRKRRRSQKRATTIKHTYTADMLRIYLRCEENFPISVYLYPVAYRTI